MLNQQHAYTLKTVWTGNTGSGTSSYRAYSRNYEVHIKGKPVMPGSSDPMFRGDKTLYNPEDLLVAALSSCHMLWYLHLCAENEIIVTAYEDNAEGIMQFNKDGSGQFVSVTLKPLVVITDNTKISLAETLHHQAHDMCFIARSVNFQVSFVPMIERR